MREDEKTPVRIAIKEALTPAKAKRGRPKNTWLKTIANDLNRGGFEINVNNHNPEETVQKLISITQDRKTWKVITETLMQ